MMSLDIKYPSEKHATLKEAVLDRKKFSERKMGSFRSQWDDADDSLKAYIPESELDRKKKSDKKQLGKVDYVTLEVPYVYAQVMTAHTYWATIFLSRQPVWQFTARHGEGQDSVMAVEAVMDYQLQVGNQLPVLYNWLYDLARYSLGVVGVYWDSQEQVVTQIVEEPQTLLGVKIGGTKRVLKETRVRGYEGNCLYNVRPYDFFPDPRVPINRFQDGEFCIRETSEGYSSLLNYHQSNPGYYINMDELFKRMKKKEIAEGDALNTGTSRIELPYGPGEGGSLPGTGFVKLSECYIKLVPETWGLTQSKRTETWCITLADDEIIIAVKPLGFLHSKFPFSVLEGNFGSDSFAKMGIVEIIRPLTDVMTFLVNSHFYNVRKVLNDTRVVDPSRIVMKDLTVPIPGGIIRLKPEAYGTDPRTAIHQLTNVDMTRSHINDVQFVENIIERVSGVAENIMGVQSASSRKSATEARIASGFSTSRLKVPSEYNSALGWSPLAQMMLMNTQQLMTAEQKYSIAGNTMDQAKAFMEVDPAKISGFYNFVPVDGTMPIDRLAQANFWKELLMQMARVPQLAMQFDMPSMLMHVMKMQGERNIDRFKINVSPQQQLQAQAQAGNVVPLQGAGGGGPPRGTGRDPTRNTGSSGGTL
jgi:hypothetical protein